MKFILNKLCVNGAKSIDKPIELLFSNRTISCLKSTNNSKVKAIYGPNGSGKSGIMSAMYIYKRLIIDADGINDKVFSNFIMEIINKRTKVLTIEVIFTVLEIKGSKDLCFKHKIKVGVEDDIVSIIKEEVSILNGNSIKDEKFKALIKIENGKIIYLQTLKNIEMKDDPLFIYSMNLLSKRSIASTIDRIMNQDIKKSSDLNVIISLFAIMLFSYKVVVELNKEDIHYDYISNKIREKTYDSIEKASKFLEEGAKLLSPSEYLIHLSSQNRDIVDEKELEKYENNIRQLTEFIKIFKPDLDKIIIDKKVNENKYYCDKIFVYGETRINVEFESTGIKKLVKLFTTLKLCANGAIAFIDEMDANLHDVYFAKIIEFFKNDSKGQLCFTTHNLEPIDILKSNSHSLDFISNDSRVYSWVKDGNKSPMSKYIKGLIPYSPFNVESFDFDVLLEEDL